MAAIPKLRKTKHQKNVIMRIAIRIAAIVVAAVVLVVLYLALFTDAFSPKSKLTEVDIPKDAKITATAENLYYFSGKTLTSVDRNGKVAWQSKFEGEDLKIAASENLICIYNGHLATVLDSEKNILFNIPASGFTFHEAQCGKNSIALLSTLQDTENMEYIRVFDITGTEIYRSTNEDINTLNFGLSGQNDNLWMLTLDTTGVEPISRISLSAPAQNALTGTVEISDQLVSDIYFFDTDMYVSGTNSLTQYDTFGNKGSSTLVYGLKCIDAAYSGNDYALLYVQRNTENASNAVAMRILAKNSNGEMDSFLQMPEEAISIHASTSHVFCFLKDSVRIYALTGEFIEEQEMDFEILSTKKITANEVLLYTEDEVYIMNLS